MKLFSFFLCLHLLMIVTAVLFRLTESLRLQRGARQQLLFSKVIMFLMPAVAFFAITLPKPDLIHPVIKVEARASVGSPLNVPEKDYLLPAHSSLAAAQPSQWWSLGNAGKLGWLWLLFSVLFVGARLARDIAAARRLSLGSFVIRDLSGVRIAVTDSVRAPCSWWSGARLWIFIPSWIVADRSAMNIALLHELQHHRQNDGLWVYLMRAFQGLFFANPFFHLWKQRFELLQEYACDEAVIGRSNVKPIDYARALCTAARGSINSHDGAPGIPACATGFLGWHRKGILLRRIEMISVRKKRGGRLSLALLTGLVVVSWAALGIASRDWVQDRRVSEKEAMAWAAKARQESEIPVVVNEHVLRWLRQYVGTSEGRQKIRAALERMHAHRGMITSKMKIYGVPEELLAVPIIESGYRSLPQRLNHRSTSAGMWQFIVSTAKNYGMRVDAQVDDRMNPEIESDAAMRLILANKLRFKDWWLSMLAYNWGETSLQAAMDKTGLRNAWDLVNAGYEGDHHYLPKLMAALIVMKNPEIVKD